MNKNYILALTTLFVTAATSAAADYSIGLIDFAEIQERYHRTLSERESFDAEKAKVLNRIEEKRAKVNELLADHSKDRSRLEDPTLSQNLKDEITQEATERAQMIMGMQKEIREDELSANRDLSKVAKRVQDEITSEIYEKIGELAEQKGFDLVLNRSFGINGVPTLAYSKTDNVEDYTDEVIAALNANAPNSAEQEE
ncbi:MAG: OmpH family outer membrane protein [Verrucomicrobiota bacterium]